MSDDSLDHVRRVTDELQRGVRVCLADELTVPSLMILYGGMDAFAKLDLPSSREDVTRNDFNYWTDKYVTPNLSASCTAIELYGARCAVLHGYGSESALSREGKARQIWYAWGDKNAGELQTLIQKAGKDKIAVALQVEELVDAFGTGATAFLEEVSEDSRRAKVVATKGKKMFGHLVDPGP